MKSPLKYSWLLILAVAIAFGTHAQKRNRSNDDSKGLDPKYFDGMAYRSVGPTRGGRSTAITGIPEAPYTFFMGGTGGGVWRTDDAGTSWENISDGQIDAGSIGAIEVAPSDENVMFVGTGSACPRGNVSPGIGVYKSTDQGKTWSHSGLKSAGQIGKIIIHPDNPDVVFVAALGNIFGPNPERGVFKTTDGGTTWNKVLFISNQTGIVDMAINPKNPRILYAAAWQAERKPWTMIDGGKEGGIYQSRDGGETWTKLEKDLPTGLLGRIGLAISPTNPDRIWALIQSPEEEDGGIYRSDDGGGSWKRINRDHRHQQRGWYYTHLTADPQDENTLYSSNTGFYKSIDGGENFERIRTPHGDNHGVWVNPINTQIMINCNDGGANVSLNGGKTWSTQLNQPTSEFYRVTVDNQFPYRLYAGQQDNTTISVPSQGTYTLTDSEQWYGVGGGESADVAVHPDDPDVIYAGTYSGEITYVNRKTGQRLQMTSYPHYTEGTEQRDLKYRWQWNFPLFVSVHNSDELYMGSNYVHRSRDKGQNWEVISPDLTRSLDKYHDIPGGPIQHDGTGVEIYSTIFALEESPKNPGEIWAGSDDGRIHITRDGGKNWNEITPDQMPSEGTVNKIELSTHADGKAYVAVYKYRDNDYRPYIFRTINYGQSWDLLTTGGNGIPSNHFVRSVAEDPDREGLLYAGTEFGVYLSFDEGQNWQPLQLNLPVVPITDMEVHKKDLVLSTQGRAFWILDDLTPLQQLNATLINNNNFLYQSRETYRTNIGGWGGLKSAINFYVGSETEEDVVLSVTDQSGRLVSVWSSKAENNSDTLNFELQKGFNQIKWDQTYLPPKMVSNFIAMDFSHDNVPGQKAVPGIYSVKLSIGDWSDSKDLLIKNDPRWTDLETADYQKKFDLENEIIEHIEMSQQVIRNIREIRMQANSIASAAKEGGIGDELIDKAKTLSASLTAIEETLIQNKIETTQDEINFPRVFSNHLARLYRVVVDENNAPTGGMLERWADLKSRFSELKKPYDQLIEGALVEFNQLVTDKGAGKVILSISN